MSDIPSGALEAGQSRAVSLLARVILPRPGEPLDVRKLYIEESDTNARRAHAPTRTTLEIGAESEVSFATYFNAFPASYWRRWSTLESVVLRVELTGSARVDVHRNDPDEVLVAVHVAVDRGWCHAHLVGDRAQRHLTGSGHQATRGLDDAAHGLGAVLLTGQRHVASTLRRGGG